VSSLSLNLAFRYLKSNRGGVFSFTSFLAILGLSIGVSSLIIVMSVMNGFERELQDRILGVVPHAVIKSDSTINNYQLLVDNINKLDNIKSSSPYIELQGLASSGSGGRGVSIIGIDEDIEPSMSILPDYMVIGSLDNLKEDSSIIIGTWLAAHLDVGIGDTLNITTSDIKTTIIGSFPQSLKVKIVGMYELRSELDQSLVLISHKLAQKIKMIGENTTSSIRIKTDDLFSADTIARDVIKSIDGDLLNGNFFEIITWKTTHGTLFEAIKFEKLLISLMLFLIIGVASILILSTIIMTVKSKEREIGILKTIGANNGQLVKIFVYQGILVSSIGIISGLFFGILITINLDSLVNFLESLTARGMLDAYFINYFPYHLDFNQIFFICLLSFIFSLFSSLIPALRVNRLDPIEILRHE
jgi:lipoprotein-releasing system permease protein